MTTPVEWPTHPVRDPDSRFHGGTMADVDRNLDEANAWATGLDVWNVLDKVYDPTRDGDSDLATAQLASLEHAILTGIPALPAHQWWRNGDHPDDRVGQRVTDPLTMTDYTRVEGRVVRYFRRPEPQYAGDIVHEPCERAWRDHGWIDEGGEGATVCPGGYVFTLPDGLHAVHNPGDRRT